MKAIIKVIAFCVFIVFLFPQPGNTCTTFLLEIDGRQVVGKNYDWHLERGLVIINKRRVSKTALGDKEKDPGPFAHWTSKYGSLTFNQYGRELPMGGINEAGLVVELMSLPDTTYPAPNDRPAVSELQWIQYQLDNFSRVEQVIASDAQVRIYPGEGNGIHFLITDKEDNCAVIEFLDGNMVYHTQKTLPIKVLTNNTYTESMAYLKWHKGFGGDRFISYSSGSLDRFVRAANMLKNHDSKTRASPIDYAFDILRNVANPSTAWGTKWSIVYDIKNLRVYFRTFTKKQIRYMDLRSFDFSCKTPVNVLDINIDESGDVAALFQNYTQQMNLDLIRHSFKATYFLMNTPDDVLEGLARYPDSARCTE